MLFFAARRSANVILDESFTAKIADFGETRYQESVQRGTSSLSLWRRDSDLMRHTHDTVDGAPMKYGTIPWASPEVVLGKDATMASDVFAFGLILWELVTFKEPFVLVARVKEQSRSRSSSGASISLDTTHAQSHDQHVVDIDHKFSLHNRPNRQERERRNQMRCVALGAWRCSLRNRSASNERAEPIVPPSCARVARRRPDTAVLPVAGEIAYTPRVSSQPLTNPLLVRQRSGSGDRHNAFQGGGGLEPSSPGLRPSSYSFDDMNIMGGVSGSARQLSPVIPVDISTQQQAIEYMVEQKYRPPLPVGVNTQLTSVSPLSLAPLCAQRLCQGMTPLGAISLSVFVDVGWHSFDVQLMQKCWQADPGSRPTFFDVAITLENVAVAIRGSSMDDDTSSTHTSFPCEVANMVCYSL